MNKKTTKLFLDTEFSGLHKNTTLISLGLVSECGKTFYAEFVDYDKSQIDDWLRVNVLANLFLKSGKIQSFAVSDGYSIVVSATSGIIKTELIDWLLQFNHVQIWSDCLAYDWVLFNDIFGTAFDLSKNISYIPHDICTLFDIKGIDPDISREEFIENSVEGTKHNALYDAKVIKACYDKLMRM